MVPTASAWPAAPLADDFLGQDAATAGDFNGDGIDDFFIGAARADHAGEDFGALYLVLGKTTAFSKSDLAVLSLNSSTGIRFEGTSNSFTGFNTSHAGDVNGDGISDIVIGAMNASPAGNSSGSAYVVFGSQTVPGRCCFPWRSEMVQTVFRSTARSILTGSAAALAAAVTSTATAFQMSSSVPSPPPPAAQVPPMSSSAEQTASMHGWTMTT